MIRFGNVFAAEMLKTKNSVFVPITFIAFALAPVIGGVFILLLGHPEIASIDGGLALKAQAMKIDADWNSYLSILTQAVGVGGVMVFGFTASWVFGREYSDGTAKDLLSLPASRTTILNAKFMVYALWCTALGASNLLLGTIIGIALGLPDPVPDIIVSQLGDYTITAMMTMTAGMPIAFFAVLGKGYLPPLGFMAITLVFAQVIAAIGFGTYFPWSIPGLYGGAGGDYKHLLNFISYSIVALTGIAGYLATVVYWNTADQFE